MKLSQYMEVLEDIILEKGDIDVADLEENLKGMLTKDEDS